MNSRTDLTAAFKTLRGLNLIALQNFSCCSGCAGEALADRAVARVQRGKEVTGVVFYHRQDTADRDGGRVLFIRFGSIYTQEFGDIGVDSLTVGELAAAAFDEHGLEFEWTVEVGDCICLKPFGKIRGLTM